MVCNINKLEQLMLSQRYNKSQLAKKAKINKSTLCRKMHNGEAFTIEEANNIASALNMTKEDAIIIFFPSCLKNEKRKE